MAGLIEEKFQEAVDDAESPSFHYTTTIQNHMSYTADKYGEGYDYPDVPLTVSVSEEVETLLKATSRAPGTPTPCWAAWDYSPPRGEPVVLVFWGDHLPYLGDNQLAYAELGLRWPCRRTTGRTPCAPMRRPM